MLSVSAVEQEKWREKAVMLDGQPVDVQLAYVK